MNVLPYRQFLKITQDYLFLSITGSHKSTFALMTRNILQQLICRKSLLKCQIVHVASAFSWMRMSSTTVAEQWFQSHVNKITMFEQKFSYFIKKGLTFFQLDHKQKLQSLELTSWLLWEPSYTYTVANLILKYIFDTTLRQSTNIVH